MPRRTWLFVGLDQEMRAWMAEMMNGGSDEEILLLYWYVDLVHRAATGVVQDLPV